MQKTVQKIQSFQVDHTKFGAGLYLSRVDGDVYTFDLRFCRPNGGRYLDSVTMHTVEHLFATYVRSSPFRDRVIYFGPMGCRTGFYLLLKDVDLSAVSQLVKDTLQKILSHEGPVFGQSAVECGNYRELDLSAAQTACRAYLAVLENGEITFRYGDAPLPLPEKKDITGIIGAMDLEMETLCSLLEEEESRTVSGVTFHRGKLFGKEAVLAVCGIGKGFAALCAQTMILLYRPARIINVGVAGTLTDRLSIGHIAVATQVVQHDMDTSPLGDPVGLISGINIVNLPCDAVLSAKILQIAAEKSIPAIGGCIASGDCFVSSVELKERIASTFDAVACEMEGGGIAQVCYVNQTPCAVIRAISDSADGGCDHYERFKHRAAERSASVLSALMQQL